MLKLSAILFIFIANSIIIAQETVELNILPKVEYTFDQNQVGNANSFSFQLNTISDFYSMRITKVQENSKEDKKNTSNNQNDVSNQKDKQNESEIKESKPECSLNVEGGELETVENFEIYQNIISENEYIYYYLDSQLQLYTYRVQTKKETFKYLGHKKIEFEDFVLNTSDPNSPLRFLVNDNFSSNKKLLRGYNNSKEENEISDNINIKQNNNLQESFSSHSFLDQNKHQRQLGQSKEMQTGQYITYLKLLQWKDQIICVLNTTVYIIVQDKGYKISKIDKLLDIDIEDDYLFVALGSEGVKIFEISQEKENPQQSIKDIQLKQITDLNWKDQYVRQIQVVKNKIYFVNKQFIYIYNFTGNSFSYRCMIGDNELKNNREIEKIFIHDNTLIALTQQKSIEGSKQIDLKESQKGYIEYTLNLDSSDQNESSTNSKYSNGDQNFDFGKQQGIGHCYLKIKEENDLSNGIKDVQIDDQYIYFGLENGIHGIKKSIKSQYLSDIPKNKWTNNFIPNLSHFKKIDDSSFFMVANGHRFSLINFSKFNLTLVCNQNKIFEQGNLIQQNGNENVHINQLEYQIQYVSNQCIIELKKYKNDVTKQYIDFSKFKEAFGYESQTKYEDIHFLNKQDTNTCIIQHDLFIKQNTVSEASNNDFIIGIICALIAGLLLFFIIYYYKCRNNPTTSGNSPKSNKRANKINSSQKSTEDSTAQKSTGKSSTNQYSKRDSVNNINNNSSNCILSSTKSTKNQQSGIFGDQTYNQHNQSNNDHSYNQYNNRNADDKEKNDDQGNNEQEENDYIFSQQQTQLLLMQLQKEQQLFIQQILQNPQFQQLNKQQQEIFLQNQYKQHLDYQRSVRIQQLRQQQIKQQQSKGKKKGSSPIQRKYGGGVDPILETDSDKKMSTRRDQEQFYRMKKRNNLFEENLIRSVQKNQDVINDLNLNIQLEENSQPPNHNVFSPQNYGNIDIEVEGHDEGDTDDIIQNNKQAFTKPDNRDPNMQNESIPTDYVSKQNPAIAFMTLQSIQNSLKNKQQEQSPSKQSSQYQKYEDEEESDQNNIEEEKEGSNESQEGNQNIHHVTQEDSYSNGESIQEQISNDDGSDQIKKKLNKRE